MVDYIIGGSYDDTLEGNEGIDLVFGDHGLIHLSKDDPYKLIYATTADAYCTPGSDNITLGDGDDLAFGGGSGDTIYGSAGQDVIYGDFGYFDAEIDILPHRKVVSIVDQWEYGGADHMYGDEDDDLIVGGEGNDFIEGGQGSDDIIGG